MILDKRCSGNKDVMDEAFRGWIRSRRKKSKRSWNEILEVDNTNHERAVVGLGSHFHFPMPPLCPHIYYPHGNQPSWTQHKKVVLSIWSLF